MTKLLYDNGNQTVIAYGGGDWLGGCEETYCSDGTLHVLATGVVAELMGSSEPIKFYI